MPHLMQGLLASAGLVLVLGCRNVATVQEGAAKDGFNRERKGASGEAKDALEGKAPPPLQVEGWVNTDGKALDLQSLKGKVVVLKFWGVWCGPCVASMPHLAELQDKHKDQLVFVGIHTKNRGPDMAAFMKEQKLTFPCAVDAGEKTVAAYHADSFPDYYLIDRSGNLRIADLANGDLDRAIEALLEDPVPKESAESRPASRPQR